MICNKFNKINTKLVHNFFKNVIKNTPSLYTKHFQIYNLRLKTKTPNHFVIAKRKPGTQILMIIIFIFIH